MCFETFASISFAWEPNENESIIMNSGGPKNIEAGKSDHDSCVIDSESNENELEQIFENDYEHDNEESSNDNFLIMPKRIRRYVQEATLMTKKTYWTRLFTPTLHLDVVHRSLIDSEILLWSYLEAGLIGFFSSMLSFWVILSFEFGIPIDVILNATRSGGYFSPHADDLDLGGGVYLVSAFFFFSFICQRIVLNNVYHNIYIYIYIYILLRVEMISMKH